MTLWAGIEGRAALEGGWGLEYRLPAPATEGAAVPFLGVTVQLEQYSPPERAAALDRLRAAGFGWARQRFDWGEIEPQPGQYDWSRSDAILDAVVAAGLAPVVVLDGSPVWARSPFDAPPHDNPLAPPADPATFARFATAFAQRYGERIRYYQLWDEPNIAPHWGNRLIEPVAYTQLLRAASQAIRRVDADAVIIAAALAPTGDRGHTAIDEIYFLQRMVAAGAAPYFDVVSLEPFGFGHSPRYPWQTIATLDFQRTALLRRALVAAGLGEKPVWIARFGWNTDPNSPWGVVTPDDQATYTVDALTIGRNEWPWLAAMGWAIDRPAAPTHDPSMGICARRS